MTTKYKIERIRNKVRVKRIGVSGDWSTTLTDKDWAAIDAWVQQTDCGYRVAYDMWKLKDKQSTTLFILKWGE